MNLTDSARSRLESYLAAVRTALADRPDIDVGEVVAGLREHIEADLGASQRRAPCTEAEVLAMLERLGPPEEVAGGPNGSGGSLPQGVPTAGAAALALGSLGAVLVLAEFWSAVGWLGLIIGAFLARSVLDARPFPTASPVGGLLRLYWSVAAVAVLVALVLGPAILIWALTQTGGPLAPPARAAWDGSVSAYWRWIAGAAGLASGAWWLFLGFVLRPFGDALRSASGGASYLLPRDTPRVLIVAGASALILSTLVWIR